MSANGQSSRAVCFRVLSTEQCERIVQAALAAQERSGSAFREPQAMLTIHCGRHSCTSHLLAAGWPVTALDDQVPRRLGHPRWYVKAGNATQVAL